MVINEIPSGLIDGANLVFTLSRAPASSALKLWRNGVLQQYSTEFTLAGTVITFVSAPLVSDWLFASYETDTPGCGTPVVALGDIASWVAIDKLKRPDYLDLATREASNFYFLLCTKVPFEILQKTTDELPVQTGVSKYCIGGLCPDLAGIVSIRMTYSVNSSRRLKRSHVRLYDALQINNTPGRPYMYARWGYNLEFQPVPDLSSYTYRLRYWARPTVPASTVTAIANTIILIPVEWHELMRWETLYRVYMNLEQYEKAQALMGGPGYPRQQSPKKTISFETAMIPRLWNDLLLTVSQRENVDEDFSINPVSRPYTYSVGR